MDYLELAILGWFAVGGAIAWLTQEGWDEIAPMSVHKIRPIDWTDPASRCFGCHWEDPDAHLSRYPVAGSVHLCTYMCVFKPEESR